MFFAMNSVGLSRTPAKSPNPVMTKWTISGFQCPCRAHAWSVHPFQASNDYLAFPFPPYASLMMIRDILMHCALHDGIVVPRESMRKSGT